MSKPSCKKILSPRSIDILPQAKACFLANLHVRSLRNKDVRRDINRLVPAIQRNHNLISFDPFSTAAAKRMGGISGPGLTLLQEKQTGGKGLHADVVNAMHPTLSGRSLDIMNQKMISGLCPSIDALPGKAESVVDLHAWCRDAVTIASTRAVWGSKNPFESQELRDAFW